VLHQRCAWCARRPISRVVQQQLVLRVRPCAALCPSRVLCSSGRLWTLLTAAERPGGGSSAGQHHVSGLTLSSVVRQAALKTLAGQLTLFPAYLSLFFVWTGVLEVRARQAP